MNNRIDQYLQYHAASSRALDIDTQVEALRYLCDRFELNSEQRYWLWFLFATNYCTATTYYMYNEFPDFATVDTARIRRWWIANRTKLIFQTDRAWIKRKDCFVEVFQSYGAEIARLASVTASQEQAISNAIQGASQEAAYDALCSNFHVREFGRFTLFNYTELLHALCGVNIAARLDLREAESSRNGLCFAVGMEQAYTGRHGRTLPDEVISTLDGALQYVVERVKQLPIRQRHKSMWSIETTLCAFKKHVLNNNRWVGYYIERQRKEIVKMERLTGKQAGGGVSWLPLWQFRTETYNTHYLKDGR